MLIWLFTLEGFMPSSFVDNFLNNIICVIICTSTYIISAPSFFTLTYFCSIYFVYFFFLGKVTVSNIKINLFKFTKCLIGTTKLMPLTLAYADTTGDHNAMRNLHPWERICLCF